MHAAYIVMYTMYIELIIIFSSDIHTYVYIYIYIYIHSVAGATMQNYMKTMYNNYIKALTQSMYIVGMYMHT